MYWSVYLQDALAPHALARLVPAASARRSLTPFLALPCCPPSLSASHQRPSGRARSPLPARRRPRPAAADGPAAVRLLQAARRPHYVAFISGGPLGARVPGTMGGGSGGVGETCPMHSGF